MLCVLWLVACGPNEPDLSELIGRYNVLVDGINGCANDLELVEWMNGPLEISSADDGLIFDFSDGMAFEGRVTDAGRFSYFGSGQLDERSYSSSGGGTVDGTKGSWNLNGEGTSTIQDDGSLNCSIVTSFTAVQIAE
ncbi:MAG: hypothetical protein ACI9MC_000387 [Kiritimatiellia bacterium]|jgi:hypothetical protein